MNTSLAKVFSTISSSVERRLFLEYGAIFATTAMPPPKIIFADGAEVERFQSSLALRRGRIADHEIELQAEAMDALLRAVSEIELRGGRITARAADAGGRSYQDTVGLWVRNVTRGLEHWESVGRISKDDAQLIKDLSPVDQVEVILDLEETRQLFFGTFFDKSILYSVAAPGSSQHLSLLAFDVAEYEDSEVERVLGLHGWHRTVPNDLPHFTYLGHNREMLFDLGLTRVTRQYDLSSYSFYVPDIDSLGETG
jgi:hypothetical protein